MLVYDNGATQGKGREVNIVGHEVAQITIQDVVVDYEVLRERLARSAARAEADGTLADREPVVAFALNVIRCVEGREGQEKTDLELVRFGEPLSIEEARRRLTEMGITPSDYPDSLSLRGRDEELTESGVGEVAVIGTKSVLPGQEVALYLWMQDSKISIAEHDPRRPWGKDAYFLGRRRRRSSNPRRRATTTKAGRKK